jgi:hypothetical protein
MPPKYATAKVMACSSCRKNSTKTGGSNAMMPHLAAATSAAKMMRLRADTVRFNRRQRNIISASANAIIPISGPISASEMPCCFQSSAPKPASTMWME